jgi:predicted phosphatase
MIYKPLNIFEMIKYLIWIDDNDDDDPLEIEMPLELKRNELIYINDNRCRIKDVIPVIHNDKFVHVDCSVEIISL